MPSTRARVYIYKIPLTEAKLSVKIVPVINDFFCKLRIEGNRNKPFIRPFFVLNAIFRLLFFVILTPFYDYIVVQKIVFPIPLIPIMSRLFINKKTYFDMDDIIHRYHQSDSKSTKQNKKLKLKFKKNMSLYNKIITTNDFLKNELINTFDFPSDFIYKIHDPVDTDHFKTSRKEHNETITLGWIGTPTNTMYLTECLEEILKIRDEGYIFRLMVAGVDRVLLNKKFGNDLDIDFREWYLEDEKDLYDQLDIGLMPLPNDEWSNSKGGYKLMLYMSMEKIAVASNVGVNGCIVDDGENGFLISSKKEWYDKIKYILDNINDFHTLKIKARETIQMEYSLKTLGNRYLDLFR